MPRKRKRKPKSNIEFATRVNQFTRGLRAPDDLLLIIRPEDRVANFVQRYGLTYQLTSAIVRGLAHVTAKYSRTI